MNKLSRDERRSSEFDHLRGLTPDEKRTRRDELLRDAQNMLDRSEDVLTPEDEKRYDRISRDLQWLGEAQEQQDTLRSLVAEGSVVPGTPTTTRTSAPSFRDDALRSIERSLTAKHIGADDAGTLETIVGRSRGNANWAAAAANPDYATAFGKLLRDPQNGSLEFSDSEKRAFIEARTVQRAMSEGGDAGVLVPAVLDPVIKLSNGSFGPNSIRQYATVTQVAGNEYLAITSAGVEAGWKPELAEADDDSPVLAEVPIKAHKGVAWVPFSIELDQDFMSLQAQLTAMLGEAALELSETAYMVGTGDGSDQPWGLVTRLLAAAGSNVTNANDETAFAALQNALPPRFQANASFLMNLAELNQVREYETTNGAIKFPGATLNPPSILGRPVIEHSVAGADVLVYGDFSQFQIIDRVGTTVELIPHLFGANRRPLGARGLYMHFRTGSDVLIPGAFRILDTTP